MISWAVGETQSDLFMQCLFSEHLLGARHCPRLWSCNRIRQSPFLQEGGTLLPLTENNRNCPLCRVMTRTKKMQQLGAWKDGALFNRMVRGDLLEGGMRMLSCRK